jgi:hypothetical protein
MERNSTKTEQQRLYNRVFALCQRNGINDDARRTMISSFTDGETESLKGLSITKLREFVNRLSAMCPDTTPEPKKGKIILKRGKELKDHEYALFNIKNHQHMTILSLTQSLGHTVYSPKYDRYVADLNWLGGWIRKYAKYKTPLLEQTTKQLQITIEQLQKVVKDHYKS